MSEKAIPYRRRGDILRQLHHNGPLSVSALNRILTPTMSKKGIALSLRRLRKRGFVVRRFDSLPNNVEHFYQLSNNYNIGLEVFELTGIDPFHLRSPQIRDQELYHSQSCALWANKLKQLYPEARIIRDHQILFDEEAKNALLLDPDRFYLQPDIMMFFPKTDTAQRLAIGIEVERTRKTNARLINKLKKLAHTTRLDGIVYICDDDGIANVVRSLYNEKVRNQTLTPPYRANYLVFIPDHSLDIGNSHFVINSDVKVAGLQNWIQFLKTTKRNFRRDSQLKMWGDAPTLEETKS